MYNAKIIMKTCTVVNLTTECKLLNVQYEISIIILLYPIAIRPSIYNTY